jgi:hypothetical protein
MCRLGALLATVLIGAAGCESPEARAPGRLLHPHRSLLGVPRVMLDDYTYPAASVRQEFVWGADKEPEWKIHVEAAGYAYAGILLRHPVDLSKDLRTHDLTFYLQPAGCASNLSIALVDGDAVSPRVLLDRALTTAEMDVKRKAAVVRFPLAGFDREGASLSGDGSTAPFDWSDIREIRFIVHDAPKRLDLLIKHLRVQRDGEESP